MSSMWKRHGWKVLGLTIALALQSPQMASAQILGGLFGGGCCNSCPHFHCPHVKFCVEGPPRVCLKQSCPKPAINPCAQPNWGYYQTCWSPWPWPPDWNHCPVQPPATLVFPPGG